MMTGTVLRRSGEKTVVVEVSRVTRHPLYGKKMVRTKRYLVHDPQNSAQAGETVTLKESRPISARKRWTIVYGQ
jgi:small subunit ribosomal protein S17